MFDFLDLCASNKANLNMFPVPEEGQHLCLIYGCSTVCSCFHSCRLAPCGVNLFGFCVVLRSELYSFLGFCGFCLNFLYGSINCCAEGLCFQ